MPREYAEAFAEGKGSLGGGGQVFVTAGDDLAGVTSRAEAAERLSLYTDYEGTKLNLANDAVVTFKVRDPLRVGLSSPIETVPPRGYGFMHGGRTGGGAREWLFNNGTADDLGIFDITLRGLE